MASNSQYQKLLKKKQEKNIILSTFIIMGEVMITWSIVDSLNVSKSFLKSIMSIAIQTKNASSKKKN